MEPLRDDQLIAELQALRPAPRPEFAAELDERAAAGFPRRSRLRLPSFAPLRALPRRHLLLPAGGVALAVIVIATVVAIAGNQSSSDSGSSGLLSLTSPKTHPSEPQPAAKNFDGGGAHVKPSYAPSEPSHAAGEASAESEAGAATNAASAEQVVPSTRESPSFNSSFNAPHRDVERSAEVVLGAEPGDVGDDAAKVFEAVHANDGIVMRSSARQGKPGEAGATFELLLPSAKLPDALAAFSAIDEVRSRHEATADITHPTVTTAELLRESRARVDSLLAQLGEAETESEREAIEAELHRERRHAARLSGQLDHLHRRADYSRVLLRIVTGKSESSGGGAWGIDDAMHDAGHILAVAAAVTVVGLAILGPIALIALLAWLTHRAWVRRERRRVLG